MKKIVIFCLLFGKPGMIIAADELYRHFTAFQGQSDLQKVANFKQYFSSKKIDKMIKQLQGDIKALQSNLKDYQDYHCLHRNEFTKKSVFSVVKKLYVLEVNNKTTGQEQLKRAMQQVSAHITSPGGTPTLGRLESFIYTVDHTSYKALKNDELAPAMQWDTKTRVKYCFHPPLLASKCNTIDYQLVNIDENQALMMGALVSEKKLEQENKVFSKQSYRRNTNDSGSAMVLGVVVDGKIHLLEKAVFHSAQTSTLREFKYFGERISRDQCEKNAALLAKRLRLKEKRT